MTSRIHRQLARDQGFTLIELLVVILIIGILAAVAIPSFLFQKNKANHGNAQSSLKSGQTFVESYAVGNGGIYPTGSGVALSAPSSPFANASDVGSLSGVSYSGTSNTTSTYLLSAPDATGTVFFVLVWRGRSFYANSNQVTGNVSVPASVIGGTIQPGSQPVPSQGWYPDTASGWATAG